jgi:hypothetical protein
MPTSKLFSSVSCFQTDVPSRALVSSKKPNSHTGFCESDGKKIVPCRICHELESADLLLSPCACKGSVAYVHPNCLLDWITYRTQTSRGRNIEHCELCKEKLHLNWKTKKFHHWKSPSLTLEEKTKLILSLTLALIGMSFLEFYFY